LDYKIDGFETELSARSLSSAITQALGMVKAATEKRRKQLYKLNQLKQENDGRKYLKLEEKINKFPLVKPTVNPTQGAEISSRECFFHLD
jgi:hypothetical protein